MLTHEQIWSAIDRLAATFGYSPSGLAKQAGLDSTSFNKSKRIGPDGKPRWPSTESISRVLNATGATMSDFISFVDDPQSNNAETSSTVPLIEFSQVKLQGYFDAKGYPTGEHWDKAQFPEFNLNINDAIYALEIKGSATSPLYRNGDFLIISPKSKMRIGDRILIKMNDGDVLIEELTKQNASRIEVKSLNPTLKNKTLPLTDIAWISRIIWVSQ